MLFSRQAEIEHKADFLFSIGGDGTILDALSLVGNSGIPVTGINLGRLGFLSSIPKEFIIPAIEAIQTGQYQIEDRTLLTLDSPQNLFGLNNYALNEITVYKPNVMTMLTIKTWINNEFLNAYWADGLIVEVHTKPEEAMSDGEQSLLPENFEKLMKEVKRVAGAVDREL